MVAEARLAPPVFVVALERVEAPRREDVVETMPDLSSRSGVHHPAHVATVVAVQTPEGIVKVPVAEADDERALRRVPPLLPEWVVRCECLDLAVGRLVPRRVEVTAEETM